MSNSTSSTEIIARRNVRLAELVLIAGVLLSVIAWRTADRQVRTADGLRFDHLSDFVVNTLEERLQMQEQALFGLSGLLAAKDSLHRAEWRRYVGALKPGTHPSASGYGFIRNVAHADLDRFLAQTRADDAPAFAVPVLGPATNHYIVEYIEPLEPNQPSEGRDITTDPARLAGAIAAVERNAPALTARLQLKGKPEDTPGMLLLLPIFHGGEPPDALADRWSKLIGWVYARLRIHDLLHGIAESTGHQIEFAIYDSASASPESLVVDFPSMTISAGRREEATKAHPSATFESRAHLVAGKRPWTVVIRTRPAFDRTGSRWYPNLVLLSGLVVSTLTSVVVGVLRRSRQRAAKLAEQMVVELRKEMSEREHAAQRLREITRFQQAVFESAAHAIITTDRNGLIRTFNPAAQRLLGYSDTELIGLSNLTFCHEPGELRRRAEECSRLLGEEIAPGFDALVAKSRYGIPNEHEWTYVCRDGTRLRVVLSITALRDERGTITGFLGMAVDVTARKLAESRLAAFVEHAPAAVAMFDTEVRYLAVSNRWLADFGLEGRQIIGRSHYEVCPDLPEHWREVHRRCLAGSVESSDADGWRPTGSGEERHIRWEARPWFDAAGHIAGLMMFSQDITAERQRASELMRLRDAAEAANRAKGNFLAAMSHEIRTPMNGVLGFTNLLLDTSLDEEQREFVQTISSCGQNLLAIINDILDYSKIEAGKIELEHIRYDLEQAVVEAMEILASNAEAKNLQFALQIAADAPRALDGDPGRVRQILINLIGNAIKFTSAGHILVTLSRFEGARDGKVWNGVRIAVADTGIGIAADKLGLLFDKFSQADTTTARKFGGTGLGLAISKQLTELMGGQVGVESTPGQGSIFWFTLPSPPDFVPTAPEPPPEFLTGIRALIVDEYEVNRRVLHQHLTQWGLAHDTASCGREALAKLRAGVTTGRPFQLVLLDRQLSDLEGDELGRRILEDPQLTHTSLVLMIEPRQRREVEQLRAAGFAACFVKPLVRLAALRQTLVNVIKQRRATEAGSAGGGASPTPASPTKESRSGRWTVAERTGDHPVAHHVLLVEDNRVNQRLALLMLQRLGCRVDVASNGIEAVDWVSRQSFDLVFMDCHMPEMDGFEATRQIRDHERVHRAGTERLPIVALTASVLPEDQAKCFLAGMDDFITKPVRTSDLEASLTRWSRAASRAKDLAQGTASVTTTI